MEEKRSPRILIVDDEKEVVEHLCTTLQRHAFEAMGSTRGKDAIGIAQKWQPDLIILDVVMPDMDGGDVAAALGAMDATKDIPIVFLTGVLTKEEISVGDKIGKHYMLAKPITGEELLRTVRKILSGEPL